MTTRSLLALSSTLALALLVAGCSSSSTTDPSGNGDGGVDGSDTSGEDAHGSYPPPSNDPRCDSITFGAPCDGSFSCTWPGYGDCPAVGCCADKVCSCYTGPGVDAGPDGGAIGRWVCAQ